MIFHTAILCTSHSTRLHLKVIVRMNIDGAMSPMIEGELMALTLTYTVRGNAVRFISLRKASRKERRHYLWAKSLE